MASARFEARLVTPSYLASHRRTHIRRMPPPIPEQIKRGTTLFITESGFETCFGWDRWDRWDPAHKVLGSNSKIYLKSKVCATWKKGNRSFVFYCTARTHDASRDTSVYIFDPYNTQAGTVHPRVTYSTDPRRVTGSNICHAHNQPCVKYGSAFLSLTYNRNNNNNTAMVIINTGAYL